jgi:hypothetical protein
MDTSQRDRQAHDLHAAGNTWAAVAEALHYANGSVARRAAMRHAERLKGETGVKDEPATPISTPEPQEQKQPEHRNKDDQPNGWVKGTMLYHRDRPKARFSFERWNADGSAQVWGGEPQYESMHDYRVADLSNHPFDGTERLVTWAERNLHTQVTIEMLVHICGVQASAVRKFVSDRPDLYRRVKRGVYEARDPQADRAADREVEQ